jgi:hypothetical protein
VLLLTDEPFGSVDVQTGEDLVLRVRQERGIAILLVTHDIDERLHRRPRNRPHPRPRPPRSRKFKIIHPERVQCPP